MPDPEDSVGVAGRTRPLLPLALLAGLAAYVMAVAWIPGFTANSPLVCATYRALGLHCPGCGMTRALACLVRLEPAAALRYNPLVVFAAPAAAILVVEAVLAALGREGLVARRGRLLRWCLLPLVACATVLFAVRIATWIAPSCNPEGWLVPPATFPPS